MIRHHRWLMIAAALLLLAGGLRLSHATYGVDDVCYTPTAEYWLYDKPQVTSLYATNLRTPGVPTPEDVQLLTPRERTAVSTRDETLLLRLAGAVFGLLPVALALALARRLGANWWPLAGLFVAAVPWFVTADRWLVRFDPAPLVVAVSLSALIFSQHYPTNRALRWLHVIAALSLLLVAPPLWWLALALLILHPRPNWRVGAFVTLLGLIAVPSLQSLYHWFGAASQWDTGATAACAWALLALALWRWRILPPAYHAVLIVAVIAAGGLGLWEASQLPVLSPSQTALAAWLQTRLPDGARAAFDSHSWRAAAVATCPMGANAAFSPQRWNSRDQLPPDYIVTTDRANLEKSAFIHDLGNGFLVGRQLVLPQPMDVPIGDLLYVISAQIVTPQTTPGDVVHVRLDFQLGPAVTADALRYAAFIHVIPPGQPGDKVVDFNIPLVQELPIFGPRRIVTNQHYRFPLPAETRPGLYEVIFGIYDVYTGARLTTPTGDTLTIGQLTVAAPE